MAIGNIESFRIDIAKSYANLAYEQLHTWSNKENEENPQTLQQAYDNLNAATDELVILRNQIRSYWRHTDQPTKEIRDK